MALNFWLTYEAASSTRDRSIWLIGRKPRMPSTSTSRPPLTVLVDPGLDGHAFLQVGPVGLDRGPLEPEDLNAFLGVEAFDDDLDGRARLGQLAVFKIGDREDALALAAEVDEDALAADADDFAGARAGPAFLASIAVAVPRAGRRPDLGDATSKLAASKSASAASSSACSPASHCRLNETSGSSSALPRAASSAASTSSSSSERRLSGRGLRER